MMLPMAMIYVAILRLQKYANEKHESECHRQEMEPLIDKEGGFEATDD